MLHLMEYASKYRLQKARKEGYAVRIALILLIFDNIVVGHGNGKGKKPRPRLSYDLTWNSMR